MTKLWQAGADASVSVANDNPRFGALLEKAFGARWWSSTAAEDCLEHIDIFFSTPDGQTYSVDIKTEARMCRADAVVNPDVQWIQVTTKKGTAGAMLGKAQFFGFLNRNGNLLTPISAVRKFFEKVVGADKEVTKHPMRENVLYRRMYRNEDGDKVCPPERSFMMRYVDLHWLSFFSISDEGAVTTLPGALMQDRWFDYYIEKTKHAWKLHTMGIPSPLYDNPKLIYEKFVAEENGEGK